MPISAGIKIMVARSWVSTHCVLRGISYKSNSTLLARSALHSHLLAPDS